MRIKNWHLLSVGIVFVLLLLPGVGEACPRCFAAASRQVLNAYYLSIAFMALIPFGIIGSIIMWVYYQARRRRLVDEQPA